MNIHIISCQVFYRDISYLAALSEHTTTVTWMEQGLHDTPDILRKKIIEEIDKIEYGVEHHLFKHNPDVIVLGYGLCSNGIVGIRSKTIPIVVPRTDDCIGIFLGSQQTYLELFKRYSGTYWLNNGWIESAFLPTPSNYEKLREQYIAQYGEDSAEFLMEQEVSWAEKYHYCGYIISPVYDSVQKQNFAREIAQYHHWEFLTFTGNHQILNHLLNGIFLTDEVLICSPGTEIVPSYDERKILAK